MHVILIVLIGMVAIIFMAFTFVIGFGAPYLPTLSPQIKAALKLADLKQGQTLLELGSGDGRVLFAAAEQGIHAIGYELNPLLVVYSKIRARRYKGRVKVYWVNFWTKKLPKADAIFVFLLDTYMERLDTKIVQETRKPVKLVSFAFQIPGREPHKASDGVYLYRYQ